MSCPCDLPRDSIPSIPPGAAPLPHVWPEFTGLRRSMLSSIRDFPALDAWSARGEGDLGVMLLEFMAYAGHLTGFYTWAFANDAFLGTAARPGAVAGLAALIGYAPRPGQPARAEIAAIAAGTAPVTLPARLQLRSGAFGAEAPQVFETEAAQVIHPAANRWAIRTPRRTTLGAPGTTVTEAFLDLAPAGLAFEAGDLMMITQGGQPLGIWRITALEPTAQADATPVTRAHLDRPLALPGDLPLAELAVLRAGTLAGLFTLPVAPGTVYGMIYYAPPLPARTAFDLDRLRPDLRPGMPVTISWGEDHRWFTARTMAPVLREVASARTVTTTITVDGADVTSSSVLPAVTTGVTRLTLDADFNAEGRRWPEFPAYIPQLGYAEAEVRYGWRVGAQIVAPPVMAVTPDLALVPEPGPDRLVPLPPEPARLRRYLIGDAGGRAFAADGWFDAAGQLRLADATLWPEPLVPPITVWGNVVPVRRGESVLAEVLGPAAGGAGGQAFALKKAPLGAAADPSGATERGWRSGLTVRVGGLAWTEVEALATAGPRDEVFALRMSPEGEPMVEFGDGTYGRRPPPGAVITADYIKGAGAAAPPAGAISQIAGKVEGLSAVLNPIGATGGADAEAPDDIRRNAPGVALLMGRVVSAEDALAVARAFPGVVAARAELGWAEDRQAAAIAITIIGAAPLGPQLEAKLRALAEPGLPVQVSVAVAQPLTVALSLTTDPRHEADAVAAAVAARLLDPRHGLLAPANIGIGAPLFRSALFAEVLAVPGAVAVPSVQADGADFAAPALRPARAGYFAVALRINGTEVGHGG